MEDLNHFLDLPSPTNSLPYGYAEADQLLDTNSSESQSPVTSPVSFPYLIECRAPANVIFGTGLTITAV